MKKTFTKIMIHAIWSTQDCLELIDKSKIKVMEEFLRNEFERLSCPVIAIGVLTDHVHCLFYLDNRKALSDVVKQIKGSSSHWMNSKVLSQDRFVWQNGFAAYSVSASVLERVREFVCEQTRIHTAKSFSDEMIEILRIAENG